MNHGLIIVDVQNDYFDGGKMELVGMDAAAENCASLLMTFRDRRAPIFHIQHLATNEGAGFFLPGTRGSEIHESLSPMEGETRVVKHFPSAFRETELEQLLRNAGIETLTLCGAMTHMCIDTTTRAAFDLGFKCRLVSDACATRDLMFADSLVEAGSVQAAFMAALSAPFAKVTSTRTWLSETKDEKTEE